MTDAAADPDTPPVPPPSPWNRTRPARTSGAAARPALTRDRIVDAAFTVLDREGYDGLTMRRVASVLQVTVSALYAHVSSKDELVELMYTRLFDGFTMPAPDPERWQEQVREYAHFGRRRLREHRDMARISMAHAPFTAELLPHVEGVLAIFRAAGLPDRIAAEAGDIISTYIDGFVLEESLWQDRMTAHGGDGSAEGASGDGRDMAERMRNYLASLPAEDFPHLRSLAGLMITDSSDERFDIGLEIILRGLASYLPDERSKGGKGIKGGENGRGEDDRNDTA
ncbi:TetR/AcrR family transcriptional regulator [Streptomyces thermoviolaceus]|uniref:TetR/AcrR family transcriptional regulator n=1 Tax=Streptomyces thermoviolaceus TaxID=1952 RepID=UPI0016786321|nr:TetR/AcrR family transcriptional regulator [Streptomyces thermoviolaceus]GGV81044.1 transcriptional regulator [Streptomyces thermoviolaceus subsp. apingens]